MPKGEDYTETLTGMRRGWYFLALPVLYIPPRIPPGAMFLGYGSAERLATEQEVDALLGPLGASAVRCAAAVTLAICILNGLGPYGGWKTAGTFTTLYRCDAVGPPARRSRPPRPLRRAADPIPPAARSNILVERDQNHVRGVADADRHRRGHRPLPPGD